MTDTNNEALGNVMVKHSRLVNCREEGNYSKNIHSEDV